MSDAAPLDAAAAVHLAHEALAGGPPLVGVTVIECEGAGPAVGARLAVWVARHAGTLGSAALDAAAVGAARELLAGERPATRRVEAGGAACTLYLEPHRAPPSLVIVGAGHIARPLCRVGAMLGFRVTVLDDRPEFATRERFPEAAEVRAADFSAPLRGVPTAGAWLVLVTRGHKYDFEVLRDVLRRPEPPAYVGMVGSRRRTRAALEQLAQEGVAPEVLRAIHAPVGLDVGAETPEEIAVSIAAELVRLRRGGSGESLRERERVAERWVLRREAPDGAADGEGDTREEPDA
ncbi:MAG TPA: XdhC family protein [Longimicrobiaceae bacterium]|nr:XdhC family protein [Longimicrobiaceae bacterium]